MADKKSTIQIPKWIQEITPAPRKYVKGMFKSLAFLKMKEYERQKEIFEHKYKMSFEQFEKKINSLKKENFEMWDDYLIWEGLHQAHQKWLNRYRKL